MPRRGRAVLEHHPRALVAVEERGVAATASTVSSPRASSPAADHHHVERDRRRAGQPCDHPRPRRDRRGLHRARRRLGLHGTDYVVGWTAWLDLVPVGVSKASGLEHVCRRARRRPADVLAIGDGRNDIEMLAGPGAGWRWARPSRRSRKPPTHVTAGVNDEGAAVEIPLVVPGRWPPAHGGRRGRTFTAELWRWTAGRDGTPGCVVLRDRARRLRRQLREPGDEPRGSGRCRSLVLARRVELGHQRFSDAATECFVLPVKKAVASRRGRGGR